MAQVMPVRMLVVCLTAWLTLAYQASAITGSLSLNFLLTPMEMPPQTEKVEFELDFETNLKLEVAISGLAISSDLGLGITGIEFWILSFATTLGTIELKSDFVFTTPFNHLSQAIGPLLFAKKRLSAQLSIDGVTIDNLALFEDVTFPDPSSTLASYASGDQNFAFGNILIVSGLLSGDLTVTHTLGLNADPQLGKVVNGGKLAFVVEKIKLEGLKLNGLSLTSETIFRPAQPITQVVILSYNLAELASVSATATFVDISRLELLEAVVTVSAPSGLSVDLLFTTSLELQQTEVTTTFSLNEGITFTAFARLCSLNLGAAPCIDQGLQNLDLKLDIALAGLNLTAVATWEDQSDNGLGDPSFLSFASGLMAAIGPVFLSFSASFLIGGLQEAGVSLTLEIPSRAI